MRSRSAPAPTTTCAFAPTAACGAGAAISTGSSRSPVRRRSFQHRSSGYAAGVSINSERSHVRGARRCSAWCWGENDEARRDRLRWQPGTQRACSTMSRPSPRATSTPARSVGIAACRAGAPTTAASSATVDTWRNAASDHRADGGYDRGRVSGELRDHGRDVCVLGQQQELARSRPRTRSTSLGSPGFGSPRSAPATPTRACWPAITACGAGATTMTARSATTTRAISTSRARRRFPRDCRRDRRVRPACVRNDPRRWIGPAGDVIDRPGSATVSSPPVRRVRCSADGDPQSAADCADRHLRDRRCRGRRLLLGHELLRSRCRTGFDIDSALIAIR